MNRAFNIYIYIYIKITVFESIFFLVRKGNIFQKQEKLFFIFFYLFGGGGVLIFCLRITEDSKYTYSPADLELTRFDCKA